MSAQPLLSVVIPAWNENDSLKLLIEEIFFVCNTQISHEIIVVDDGSTDDSWLTLLQLTKKYKHLKAIRLARNFGKASALDAGIKAAKGIYIAQLDADLQDDPAELPRMLETIQSKNVDVVVGWKSNRQDSKSKIVSSRIFNFVMRFIGRTNLRDHNSGFKMYRAGLAKSLKLYGDMHRFIPILLTGQGANIVEIPVHHRARKFGSSKYKVDRAFRWAFDLITVLFVVIFRQNPMHLLGSVGLILLFLGTGGLFYLAIVWLGGEAIANRPLMIYSAAALIVGFQMFATGMLAELFISHTSNASSMYRIKDTTLSFSEVNGNSPYQSENETPKTEHSHDTTVNLLYTDEIHT